MNPFLKIGWLREGRSIRLPLMVIFYNAILAFMVILFIVLNTNSLQTGFFTNTSLYQYQFIFLSTIQVLAVFLLTPYIVSKLFYEKENNMMGQFGMIPGMSVQYIFSKMVLLLAIQALLIVSGLPVVVLASMYTGVSVMKIPQNILLVLVCTFWSGAITVFFHTICRRSMWSLIWSVLVQLLFVLGTLMTIEMFRNGISLLANTSQATPAVTNFCTFLLMLNPLSPYMGYFGNVTGGTGVFFAICSHAGIDLSLPIFQLLFYRASYLLLIAVGVVFLVLSVRYLDRRRKG